MLLIMITTYPGALRAGMNTSYDLFFAYTRVICFFWNIF